MDLMEKLIKNISEGTKIISEKTDEIIEIAEIKVGIRNTKSEIEEAKLYIGELVYQYYLDSDNHEMIIEEINEKCKEIKKMDQQKNDLNEKLKSIKS